MSEVWIPSKTRIARDLVVDLNTTLQVSSFKSDSFTHWINAHIGVLTYIGEEKVEWVIRQVADDLGLEITEDGDYIQ